MKSEYFTAHSDMHCSNTEWNEKTIHEWFADCPDVIIENRKLSSDASILLIYCENLCNHNQIKEIVLPALHKTNPHQEITDISGQSKLFEQAVTPANLSKHIFSGELVLAYELEKQVFILNVADIPKRIPEESALDISIQGPRDGFVENYSTNLALIRNRFRSESLVLEQYTIGKRSATKVGLLYVHDIANPEYIQEIQSRLKEIDVDALISAAQLEEFISERKFTVFPLLISTGRPDFAVDCLTRGRFILLVEGNPLAIIAPANLFLVLKSPEDAHFPFWIAATGRVMRIFGLLVAFFLPGFWLALTQFNLDQLPFPILATITQTRIGLPMPAAMEMFFMLFLLDMFREAGSRLPRTIGQTLTVVGGIVIGDAAIRAAIISPTLLVIASVASVATSTIPNQVLAGAASWIRLFCFFASSFLGMYGFIISVILLVLHLATLRSFGLPYLSPVSPLTFKEAMQGVMATTRRRLSKRPAILSPQDPTRKGPDQP